MNRYKKEMRKVTITDMVESLWEITKGIKDFNEREAKVDRMFRGLILDGKSLPKHLLVDMVKNSPALLKLLSNSKEEMYKDYEQNVSWDEFLEIVKPLDDEPTAWRAE